VSKIPIIYNVVTHFNNRNIPINKKYGGIVKFLSGEVIKWRVKISFYEDWRESYFNGRREDYY